MMRAVLIRAVAVAALSVAACGGDDGRDGNVPPARPVELSGCSPVTYGGEGRPDFLIATSATLQGE